MPDLPPVYPVSPTEEDTDFLTRRIVADLIHIGRVRRRQRRFASLLIAVACFELAFLLFLLFAR